MAMFVNNFGGVTPGHLAAFTANGDIYDSGISVSSVLEAVANLPLPASPNGTLLPPASSIINNKGVAFTVINGNSYQNGVVDAGANIVFLLYWNNEVYAYCGPSIGWWVSTGSSGYEFVPGGDPRL